MAEMTTYERAIQIYQVLIAAAHNRQTITYKMLGEAVRLPARGLGPHLDHIQRYCASNGLPPLTTLVVQTGGGHPGSGLRATESVDEDRERVYAHGWFADRPLTVDPLREAKRE